MRILTTYLALILAFTTQIANASEVNCIDINSDLSLIKNLTKSGQYRNLAKGTHTLHFDYQTAHSYHDYLAFAREKINAENPKARLKCPIETGVTVALNKSKNDLVVADLVAPFELKVADSKTAILLIHGLTDSPYLFHDLAAFYYEKGIVVRTLLLPGHGTAPEALTKVDYKDWQQATQFAISQTLQDFDDIYLGGFSTGGALILDNLLSTSQPSDKIKGIMLWAPASKAKSSVAWAAQIVDWLPFVDYAHKGADIDFAKYESFPLNAGAQVHALMNKLTDKLEKSKAIPDIPLLTITSEVDATIETQATIAMLTKWHNAKNRNTQQQDTLFYFGNTASLANLPKSVNQILPICSNKDFCSSIVNVAHTSVTNAPSNPHYGWQGNYRNCEAISDIKNYQTCKKTNKVTLGETTEENFKQFPSLQRLTFNPNFKQMTKVINNFLSETQ